MGSGSTSGEKRGVLGGVSSLDVVLAFENSNLIKSRVSDLDWWVGGVVGTVNMLV